MDTSHWISKTGISEQSFRTFDFDASSFNASSSDVLWTRGLLSFSKTEFWPVPSKDVSLLCYLSLPFQPCFLALVEAHVAVLCIRRNETFSVCTGMSLNLFKILKTLNVDEFEAVTFTNNKGFIMETTCAGAVGDFENGGFMLSQNKYSGTCLDSLKQSKQSYHISLAAVW